MKNLRENRKIQQQSQHKTRLQKLIERYESNQAFIQRVVNLTTDEYSLELFETGIAFLEEMYPRAKFFGDDMYEYHYKKHAYNKAFWKWWKLEWKKWENDLVGYLTMSVLKMSKEIWLEEMRPLAHDRQTEISFTENYLKTLQYVL